MIIKEAIEFMNWLKTIFISEHPCCKYLNDYYKKNIDGIIDLLKRGEKYEGEFKKEHNIYATYFIPTAKQLEQKYFPKLIKITSFHLTVAGADDDINEFYRKINKLEDYMREKKMGFDLEWEEN